MPWAGGAARASLHACAVWTDEYGGDAGGDVDYEGGDYDDGDEYNDGGEYDDADGGDYGDEYAYGQDAGFADEVIKEGWLTKSNPQGKRWKKRCVVLLCCMPTSAAVQLGKTCASLTVPTALSSAIQPLPAPAGGAYSRTLNSRTTPAQRSETGSLKAASSSQTWKCAKAGTWSAPHAHRTC